MNEEIEIVIPAELKHMETIHTIVSSTMDGLGILILGENMKPLSDGLPTVRFYILEHDGQDFVVEREIEVFSFMDLEAAMAFVVNLPEMSALELILIREIQRGVKRPSHFYH